MSTQFVALLRGINVGKAKRVAMADLRALCEGLGYCDVRTLLNSGNIVFTSTAKSAAIAAVRIEQAMMETLGVSARVLVLTAAELDEIVRENQLAGIADNPSRLMVCVLANPADANKLKPLLKQDWGKESLAVRRRAAYVWCPQGILESKLFEAVARAVGEAQTTRNWATTLKIHALVAPRK